MSVKDKTLLGKEVARCLIERRGKVECNTVVTVEGLNGPASLQAQGVHFKDGTQVKVENHGAVWNTSIGVIPIDLVGQGGGNQLAPLVLFVFLLEVCRTKHDGKDGREDVKDPTETIVLGNQAHELAVLALGQE